MALGALHGPAELLPVSSSAHTTVVPWLLGSRYAGLDPELRKAFEVALHAGAAAGLLSARRKELAELDAKQLSLIALASLPAGIAGLTLERAIETRLGAPASIALGLVIGGLALALADRSPQERRAEEAGPADALWVGLAQAGALVPGVSRNGASLAAARSRRFKRRDADLLSRRLAIPVIAGATLLKAWRLRQRPELRRQAPELAAGALASFLSTRLAASRVQDAAAPPLIAFTVYRAGLAALILIRRRRAPSADGSA